MPATKPEPTINSVLAQMTAGIRQSKDAKSAVLTPVGAERPKDVATAESPLAGPRPTMFPFDDPQTVRTALKTARAEINHILKSLDVLDGLYGADPVAPPTAAEVEVVEKEIEKAADVRHAEFEARLAEKSKAAQAATFGSSVAALDDDTYEPDDASGWTCPVHGDESLINKTSPKGRKFTACMQCREFEK